MVSGQPTLTSICLGLASSVLGIVTVRMPSRYTALIESLFTGFGSEIERWKRPYTRSRRCAWAFLSCFDSDRSQEMLSTPSWTVTSRCSLLRPGISIVATKLSLSYVGSSGGAHPLKNSPMREMSANGASKSRSISSRSFDSCSVGAQPQVSGLLYRMSLMFSLSLFLLFCYLRYKSSELTECQVTTPKTLDRMLICKHFYYNAM